LDSISKENKGNVGIYKDKIWNSLKKITRSTISGVRTPFFDVGKAFDTGKQAFENKSFNDAVKAFEDSYVELETAVLNNIDGANRKLIVFIDDLDRCAPENVLSLLSAIKLFFTFGQKTIFICGLDEKAVDEAVKVKYGNVIKSGEYMEKIFDISFDMPKPDINKMLYHYFAELPEIETQLDKNNSKPENSKVIEKIKGFFEAMHFTNPRHIKKVLNKYLLIRYYQESGLDGDNLIPEQNIELFQYMTLFIIILYKFYPDNFEIIRDYDEKLKYLRNNADGITNIDGLDFLNNVTYDGDAEKGTMKAIFLHELKRQTIINNSSISITDKEDLIADKDKLFRVKIICLFAPRIDKYFENEEGRVNWIKEYKEQFLKEKKISLEAYFCSYINVNSGILNDDVKNSDYRLWNIFDMAERYL